MPFYKKHLVKNTNNCNTGKYKRKIQYKVYLLHLSFFSAFSGIVSGIVPGVFNIFNSSL